MQAMQANRNINLWQKKRPFSSYPAEKHPKHSKFAITNIREKPVNFFLLFNTGADFSLRNNFAKSGFCAKVSVPVHIYNSLCQLDFSFEVVFTHSTCVNNFLYKTTRALARMQT